MGYGVPGPITGRLCHPSELSFRFHYDWDASETKRALHSGYLAFPKEVLVIRTPGGREFSQVADWDIELGCVAVCS